MKNFIVTLTENSKVRYLFIGGTGFLVELGVIYVATSAGAPGTLAVALSFIVGLGYSFLLQKVITFRDKRFHHKIVLKQAIAYAVLVAFNFSFTVFSVWLLESYFPVAVIRAVALAITVIWNYYAYRTWIFKQT